MKPSKILSITGQYGEAVVKKKQFNKTFVNIGGLSFSLDKSFR